MMPKLRAVGTASALLIAIWGGGTAFAQKQGGILRMYTPDSPASMSMHEEGTVSVAGPMMAVFNNLVMFDQQVKQNSLQSIVPDLATGWSWSEDGTALTFPLRQASNGMTARRSRPRTSSAPGTWCSKSRARSFGSIRANPSIGTSIGLPPMAITRSLFI